MRYFYCTNGFCSWYQKGSCSVLKQVEAHNEKEAIKIFTQLYGIPPTAIFDTPPKPNTGWYIERAI
jgi:hypothetical protein